MESLPWENVGPAHKKSYKQAGMLVDLDRCIGCHSCSVSCKTENAVPLGDFRLRVRYLERPEPLQNSSAAALAFTPLLCMQCQDAPCLKACPSKAIKKRDDGRIIINESTCDLEQECVEACPYGAIYINEAAEAAQKCDFCEHRTENGLEPACADNCPTDALIFGDLADPDSKISKVAKAKNAKAWKAEAGTNPSVLYASHEPWMEAKANKGVQLSPKDQDITYEQNNLNK